MQMFIRVITTVIFLMVAISASFVGAALAQDAIGYEYDALGRLIEVRYNDKGVVITYSYDKAGNRTTKVIADAVTGTIIDHPSIPNLGIGSNLADLSSWPTGRASGGAATLAGWLNHGASTERLWSNTQGAGSNDSIVVMKSGQVDTVIDGGGFALSNSFTYDPTKAYEFTYYFRKYDLTQQWIYFGARSNGNGGYNLRSYTNSAEERNPYFLSRDINQQASYDPDKWYKVIGYIFPVGFAEGSSNDYGGVYDVETGARVSDVKNFRWHEDSPLTVSGTRFFTYRDQLVGSGDRFTTYFYKPSVKVTAIAYTPVVPSATITHVNVNEGSDVLYSVNLSSATTVDVVVDYAVGPGAGDGAEPNDYTATSGTLIIPSGSTTGIISVPTATDSLYEPGEILKLTLSNPVRMTLVETTEAAMIINTSPAPNFTINDVSVTEGGTVTYTVTKNGSTSISHSVDYATATGSAGTGDYTTKSGTLTFTSGQTTQTITVQTTQDSIYEASETFNVNLSNATNGATIADSQGVATITNDDVGPSFSINNVSASEGNTITFTVTKAGSTSQSHAINYATGTGSADTVDYTSKSGTLTFTSGQTTQTITVQTTQDSIYEASETFNINLSNATNNASIADSQGVATITNDDVGPSFSINNVSASEGNTITFTVTKTGSTSQSHAINYATANSSALAGSDYTSKSGTLTFTAGQTSQTVIVSGVEDTVCTENNEIFYLNLSGATNSATISDSQGAGTITDDDNCAPVVVDDFYTIDTATAAIRYPLANDTDFENNSLSITSLSPPMEVEAGINSGNTSVFLEGFVPGTYNIPYTISDGMGGTDTGAIVLTVQSGGLCTIKPWLSQCQ